MGDDIYIELAELEPYYDFEEARGYIPEEVQEYYWEDDFYQYNQNEADDYRDDMFD